MSDLKTLRFEKLTEDHIVPILEIEKESNSSPWSAQSFRNELTNPHSIFMTIFLNGEIVGYGGVWLMIDEAHITTVAVAPEHRQQGIARRVMGELLKQAKEKGMTCSTLEVRAGNTPAIRLYESLGYVISAVRKNYYPDNKEDAAIMWLYDL